MIKKLVLLFALLAPFLGGAQGISDRINVDRIYSRVGRGVSIYDTLFIKKNLLSSTLDNTSGILGITTPAGKVVYLPFQQLADSIGGARIVGDTLFVGNDTLVVYPGLWTQTGDDIENNNAGDVTLNGQIFAPDIAASGAKYSGNVAGIGLDDRLFPKSIIDLYDEIQDTLTIIGRGEAIPAPDSNYYAIIDTNYSNVDSNSVSGFRTSEAYLPNWRKDFANAYYPQISSYNDNCKIAFIGDSYANTLSSYLAQQAQDIYGRGGGYQPFAEVGPIGLETYCAKDANWTFGTDLTDTLILNSMYAQSSSAGATISLSTRYFNKLRIFYKQVSGGGTFSYQLGASGTPTNISTDGSTAAKWCYKNFAALKERPTDTVFIKVVSGTVRLYGYYFENDWNPLIYSESPQKFEAHNLSNGGTKCSDFVNKSTTAVQTLLDTLDASALFMIWLDEEIYTPYTYMSELIDEMQALTDSMDIVILSPYNDQNNLGASQARKYRALAKTKGVGYLDVSNQTGSYARNSAAGLMADNTHFNVFGYESFFHVIEKVLFSKVNTVAQLRSDAIAVNGNSVSFPNSTSIYLTGKNKSSNASVGNTALGYDALVNLTSGTYNTAIGHSALDSISTGTYNFGLGYGALFNAKSVNHCIAIGGASLYGVAATKLTGSGNIGIGYQAGYTIQGAAEYNTMLGYQAGQLGTTANQNTYVGFQAGNKNVTGNYNSYFGGQAGYFATGSPNTYAGYQAGYGISGGSNTGTYNQYYGYNAGKNATSGSLNVGIGAFALNGKTTSTYFTGSENTAVGCYAGYGQSTAADNVSVGYRANFTATTGGLNTTIGSYAGYLNSTGTNNVFLGYRAGYNETGSSKVYIASDSTSWANGMASGSKLLMYGDMSNASKANHTLNIFAKTQIGSAKTPAYTLDVLGTGYFSDDLTVNDTVYFTGAGNIMTTGNGTMHFGVGTGKVNITGDLNYDLCHGYYYFSERSEIINLTQNVYSKITKAGNNLWTNEESNGITFAGDTVTIVRPGDYVITFNFSGAGAGTNDNYRFKLYKNGVAILGSCTAKSTKAEVNWTWHCEDLVAGDDLSIRVTNTVDNDDITAENASLYIRKEHD